LQGRADLQRRCFVCFSGRVESLNHIHRVVQDMKITVMKFQSFSWPQSESAEYAWKRPKQATENVSPVPPTSFATRTAPPFQLPVQALRLLPHNIVGRSERGDIFVVFFRVLMILPQFQQVPAKYQPGSPFSKTMSRLCMKTAAAWLALHTTPLCAPHRLGRLHADLLHGAESTSFQTTACPAVRTQSARARQAAWGAIDHPCHGALTACS
jgi:hypothetical protein